MSFDLFRIVDTLAGKWIDWRTDQEVKSNPDLADIGLKKLDVNNGEINALFVSPAIALMADEASAMLERNNAKNYFEFEMMPRLDRGLPPIVVTVRWKNGKSTAQVNAELKKELEDIKSDFSDVVTNSDLRLGVIEYLIAGITNVNMLEHAIEKSRSLLLEAGLTDLAEALRSGEAASILENIGAEVDNDNVEQ